MTEERPINKWNQNIMVIAQYWVFDSVLNSIASLGKNFILRFRNTLIGFRSQRRPTYGITFCMGQAGANRKSPKTRSWETLMLQVNRVF